MTLTLNLPPELEQRLQQEAGRLGLPIDDYTLRLLEQHLPPTDRRAAMVALLPSWIDADAEEQEEAGDDLLRALDEDRLSDRPLFPPELKGISW